MFRGFTDTPAREAWETGDGPSGWSRVDGSPGGTPVGEWINRFVKTDVEVPGTDLRRGRLGSPGLQSQTPYSGPLSPPPQ